MDSQTQYNQQVKPKKPFFKKWWFWAIVIVVLISVIGATSNDSGQSNDSGTKPTKSIATEELTKADPATEKPTEDPAKVESEFKDSCDTIDFKTLSRNPDKYKGNNYKFTGEVIQVQESSWGDTVDLRVNITKEKFEYIDDVMWTDTIYATVEIPDGEDKILKDDILTFWGTCEGNYTYESVLGNSVSLPKISIKYYEISE